METRGYCSCSGLSECSAEITGASLGLGVSEVCDCHVFMCLGHALRCHCMHVPLHQRCILLSIENCPPHREYFLRKDCNMFHYIRGNHQNCYRSRRANLYPSWWVSLPQGLNSFPGIHCPGTVKNSASKVTRLIVTQGLLPTGPNTIKQHYWPSP